VTRLASHDLPCASASQVGCEFARKFQTDARTMALIDAFAAHDDTHYWGILGDNFCAPPELAHVPAASPLMCSDGRPPAKSKRARLNSCPDARRRRPDGGGDGGAVREALAAHPGQADALRAGQP
jgi:hypothetical protein